MLVLELFYMCSSSEFGKKQDQKKREEEKAMYYSRNVCTPKYSPTVPTREGTSQSTLPSLGRGQLIPAMPGPAPPDGRFTGREKLMTTHQLVCTAAYNLSYNSYNSISVLFTPPLCPNTVVAQHCVPGFFARVR